MATAKSKFAHCLHHRVRLRPTARRFRGITELRVVDDDWIVEEVETKIVRLRNMRTDHIAQLKTDQIRDYVPDPKREFDGLRHGFLELNVQVFLRGPDLVIEPRPSTVVPPKPRVRAAARKQPAAKSET